MYFHDQVVDVDEEAHDYQQDALNLFWVVLVFGQNVVQKDLVWPLSVLLLIIKCFVLEFLDEDIPVILKNVLEVEYLSSGDAIPVPRHVL